MTLSGNIQSTVKTRELELFWQKHNIGLNLFRHSLWPLVTFQILVTKVSVRHCPSDIHNRLSTEEDKRLTLNLNRTAFVKTKIWILYLSKFKRWEFYVKAWDSKSNMSTRDVFPLLYLVRPTWKIISAILKNWSNFTGLWFNTLKQHQCIIPKHQNLTSWYNPAVFYKGSKYQNVRPT